MSTPPRIIIVDDIDSRIQYNGPSWFPDKGSQDSLGIFGAPYRSTLHGTQASASLEFAYHGAEVQVYGSKTTRQSANLTWECFVDGILISVDVQDTNLNNAIFCLQDTASDGPHILTVNATIIGNQTFWFDNIRYVPSASVPLDQENIFVNNSDSQLHYGDGWQDGMTNTTGSIVTFDFIGVSNCSVSWYGSTSIGHASPADYSIDGQKLLDFVPPSTAKSFNQKFFETAQLPAGPHTLEVLYRGNNSAPLNLDYLVVQNGTRPSTVTSVSSHATSTATDNSVSSTSTAGKSSTPIGAIVGGVIGGLVVLIVFVGLLLLLRRKRRGVVSTTPQPFDFGHATLHPSNSTPNDFLPVQQSTLAIRKPLLAPLLVSRPSTSRPGRKAEVLAVLESRRRGDVLPATVPMQSNDNRLPDVVAHEDRGIRIPASAPAMSVITEDPPLYTAD